MLRYINSFVSIILLSSLVFPAAVSAELPEIPLVPALLISEVKINHDVSNATDIDEFIELYNTTTEAVDLSHYEIHYFNNLTPSVVTPTKRIQPLFSGLLLPGQHLVLAENQLHDSVADGALITDLQTSGLRNDYGRIQLIDTNTGYVIDTIAWANSNAMAEAYTLEASLPVVIVCSSCVSDKIKSLSRAAVEDHLYHLLVAEWQLAMPTPGDFSLNVPPPIEAEEPKVPDIEMPPVVAPPELTCEGLIISELLPNPAGSDVDGEFIELYNPTKDVINMSGCSIRVSGSSKELQLSGAIQPGSHQVFTASVSGLILPNSAGGTVWLLSPTEEIDTVNYPANLEDDVSWSYADSAWQVSYAVTKGALNIITSVKPCPAGQIRNSGTDRCLVPVAATVANLTPCKSGQERNPDTNRCRAMASLSSIALTPCKQGQDRNPETNRCRNISGDNDLAECAEGQERNPETNRCRKVTAEGTALAAVTDVASPIKKSSQKWWIAGVMLLAVAGYAAYEWRQDILLRTKFLIEKIKLKV